MARRPVFLPGSTLQELVVERSVEFQWFPGMAASQKQRSIISLHEAAREALHVERTLEISSKALDFRGVQASAFNLKFPLPDGRPSTVEGAYQGSKVFEAGGPFTDLYGLDSLRAKRDTRLQESGALLRFEFFGRSWGLEPTTAFYDWLYLEALAANPDLSDELLQFDSFTDIEFNPERSFSCQARSAAMFVALTRLRLFRDMHSDREVFLSCYEGQGRLL